MKKYGATVHSEIAHYITRTLKEILEKKSYQHVIRHIGKLQAHQRNSAINDRCANLYPKSNVFHEITFSLYRHSAQNETTSADQISAIEFVPVYGMINLQQLEDVLGSWYRSPPEPRECAFALACFTKYDISSGARFSLYAEFKEYGSSLHPTQHPQRLFFQAVDAGWHLDEQK